MFPRDWFVDVQVERGAGGLDRFGRPLPVDHFDVTGCLLGPLAIEDVERLGSWSENDARLFHPNFVFQQSDIVTISVDQRNAGRWEVQAPSSEWPYGTDTRVRRVNQGGPSI